MNNLKSSGIYAITHKPSGRMYIGQAVNIHIRWLQHKSALKRNQHHAKRLQNTYNRDGLGSFSIKVLERVPVEALTLREQYWLDTLNPTYNTCKIAESALGLRHTARARKRISEALKSRVYTPDIRRNMSEARKRSTKAKAALKKLHDAKRGIPRSPETKEKLRSARNGFKHKPETIELLKRIAAEAQYKHPPEVRKKISESLKGRRLSPEHVEKMRQANLGKKQSPETIKKRVAKLIGRPCSDYTKQRIAESNRGRLLGTKQTPELIEKRIAPLRGRPRPPEVISAMHDALRTKRKEQSDKIKSELIRALQKSPEATNVVLSAAIGVGVKTIRKYRKEIQCQKPMQSANASGGRSSPPKKELLSMSHFNSPQQLSLPLG